MEAPPWPLPDGVALRHSAAKGRHLVATRPFRRGELVLEQEPYRAVLLDEHRATRCDRTFGEASAGASLLRCSRSKVARYASRKAQQAAWRDGYREECAALVRCAPRVPPTTVRLAARCLLRRQREREGGSAPSWASFQALSLLEHHWGVLPPARKQLYAQMAVLVRAFLRDPADEPEAQAGDAPSLWTPTWQQAAEGGAEPPAAEPEEEEEEEGSGALPSTRSIALLLARFGSNAHTIADEELRPLGVGIFPLASMANHSCTPTAIQMFSGPTLRFIAMEELGVGEEITISYVERLAPRQERRRALFAHYFFDIDAAEPEPDPQPESASEPPLDRSGWRSTVTDGVRLTVVGGAAPTWRVDAADAMLCGLALVCDDEGSAQPLVRLPNGFLPTVDSPSVRGQDGQGLEFVAPQEAAGAGAGSLLEGLLGQGLGGSALWDQEIGQPPPEPEPEPEPDGGQGTEEEGDGGMGAEFGTNTMLEMLPEGTLRPKHSAAEIDALPDDYGQPKRLEAAEPAGGTEQAQEKVDEVRVWGEGAAAAVGAAGGAALRLLAEISATGSPDASPQQPQRTVKELRALLQRCDSLATPTDGKTLALGSGNVLRLRLQAALLSAAIAAEEWGIATACAVALEPTYAELYSAGSPLLALHWATLAKLLHYEGTRPAEALRYAERALDVVRRTHAAGGAVRDALERVRGEASMELAQAAQLGRQAQLGGK